ncbi:ferritin-like-domain-containing protein [Russula dissimulans]|nr:ferritin-like-domain-containing protein [Russula dissimulans]
MSSAQSTPGLLPPWVPRRPPGEWTLDEVHNHVKTGMIIELTTIPLYLYAVYSIKDEGAGINVRNQIRGIFRQEMLHLALAGNLLSALNGSLDLYDFEVIPRFPGKILYDEVELSLDRTNRESLDRFTKLEAPYEAPIHTLDVETTVIPDYCSIGDFYRHLDLALERRPESDFINNQDLQFTENDFRYNGELTVITSKSVAKAKLDLIVQQGEGADIVNFYTSSHYVIFRDLAEKATTWDLYNVRKNPKTSDYKGLGNPKDYAYTLSLTFDATYCYLLQNIQRVWAKGEAELHGRLAKNISNLMHRVLAPLAELLVQQRLTGDSDVAAPCFNYYPLYDDGNPKPPLEPKVLHSEALLLANWALDIAPGDDKASLKQVIDQVEQSPPE